MLQCNRYSRKTCMIFLVVMISLLGGTKYQKSPYCGSYGDDLFVYLVHWHLILITMLACIVRALQFSIPSPVIWPMLVVFGTTEAKELYIYMISLPTPTTLYYVLFAPSYDITSPHETFLQLNQNIPVKTRHACSIFLVYHMFEMNLVKVAGLVEVYLAVN